MTTCTCGAPTNNHPATGYSEAGACLEALRKSSVKTPCEWPGCGKRVRKVNLGHNFCGQHGKTQFGAFMSMMLQEGPQALSRPTPTIAERYEFSVTGKLPASRREAVTFATTTSRCAECHGPLIFVNRPDWSPDLPNALSCYYATPGDAASAQPWGIGICRKCSFEQRATA